MDETEVPAEEETPEVDAVPVRQAEPEGQVYKVVFLRVDDTGAASLWAKPHVLSAKVYDRRTALKYAAYEAQKFGDSLLDLLIAVVSPVGRCVAVLGKSGKPVRPIVSLRVKRSLASLLPGDVKPRRRTSRPVGRQKPTRKRRTSRAR